MKYFLSIIFSFMSIVLLGQSVDSLGIDNSPWLNKHEAEYLNNEFEEQRKDFDFTGKKAAFVTSSMASSHITKSEYFKEVKSRLKQNSDIIQFPMFLSNEEKINSGGYDVIVASWVKVITDKRRQQIISELKIQE